MAVSSCVHALKPQPHTSAPLLGGLLAAHVRRAMSCYAHLRYGQADSCIRATSPARAPIAGYTLARLTRRLPIRSPQMALLTVGA
eukprot:2848017-Pleurochrysis_carterae.AAC.1